MSALRRELPGGEEGNHNSASSNHQITDFAHMQIALAGRLAYTLKKDGFLSNIATAMTDENTSYLAGWLGDAIITSNGATSIPNGDYCADLDAENIYRYIVTGQVYLNAFNSYYSDIATERTRAEVFLGYLSYDVVKQKIFTYLVDYQYNFLGSKLQTDQEYYSIIQTNSPDTYNFLYSLMHEEQNLLNYLD